LIYYNTGRTTTVNYKLSIIKKDRFSTDTQKNRRTTIENHELSIRKKDLFSSDTQKNRPVVTENEIQPEQPVLSRKELKSKFGPASFYVSHPAEIPTSFVVPVYSLKKVRRIDSIELPQQLFGCPIRKDILHRVVVWHLACKRQGTAKTKNRSEVAGSSRKLARQKGLGIARVGSKKKSH